MIRFRGNRSYLYLLMAATLLPGVLVYGADAKSAAAKKKELAKATKAAQAAAKKAEAAALKELKHICTVAESAGELTKAIEFSTKLRDLQPKAVEHYSRLLRLYRRAGMAEDVVATYRGMLTVKPGNVAHTVGLGKALYHLDRKKEARAIWDGLLAGEKVPAATYRTVGNAYRDEKLLEQALVIYREGEKHHPKDAYLASGQGDALDRLGRTAEAIEAYEKARGAMPNTRSVDRKLARLYAVAGVQEDVLVRRWELADKRIEELVALHEQLGQKLTESKRHKEAVLAYEKALGYTRSEDSKARIEKSLAASRAALLPPKGATKNE
ncbi:MAG: hypothetical protein HN742_33675 [Lentisphaerae bacterium]|jgi:tetratricopeptide (TPR) repeat protein|nr:hypothetical protein [Lentisphaerota bacterium]MBT4818875.1 hypothetical protein [Lentisphaerota bacterium]MBT5611413.1 hypothetical protein [Lentisphaerota bacterium]MBT7059641.1 hypothetical protein [Lentisphaerota bacterium]MBT7846870.1 hypothetical protein [Lentisphaerota bacterium]